MSGMRRLAESGLDRTVTRVRRIGRPFLPRLCAVCSGPSSTGGTLCAGCELRLDLSAPLRTGPPPGVEAIFSAAHHDGVARELVSALKHRKLFGAAGRMATVIAERAPASAFIGPLVPVPSAPARRRKRGFDPAAEIARSLAAAVGLGVADCLRRGEGPRQVGQSRGARRAAGFVVDCVEEPPVSCTLVDDVVTTGGTLSACAIALRDEGAITISAVSFTRRR